MMKKFITLSFFFTCLTSYSAVNHILDLSYSFNKNTIYWPTEKGFNLKKIFYGFTQKGYFYSAFKFCTPEHGGTHIDAPRHFSEQGHTVDQISSNQLVGNAVVIDVRAKAKNNSDYAITVNDIKHFEKKYRLLKEQDIVLFYTGWGEFWNNKKKYLGSDKIGDVKNLHFPGLSKQAAQYLVNRKIKGIGIDTASIDPGNSNDFWAHRIILSANLYGIENVAYLHLLPILGAKLIVAPMKIKGGSGAPTRIYALI
ncbi:metal-dependent hydrolase [Legionella busanensis]|uniref:Metal-dependent hydrolase n=1 Tax=Legionella busanensis TaxID=190655 RepID=A0A378KA24_9GAMM|nr:cyclase family protein [Legionella busanensis]STX81369.1 metal-dependent hydrolase [Legionella busanensis]